ncbi:MAG: 3-dehydroquinate synthase [Anaerolineae bacterium]|nr:3-dehydroquinate synthase [Anaerolineae bacterium]
MTTLTVTHPSGSYPIFIEEGVLAGVGERLAELNHRGRCALVTNQVVGDHHAGTVLDSLRQAGFDPIRIDIPDGEQFKTLETVTGLYDAFIEARLDRRSPVLALGGGVLGDTVGFAAASFLRGVPFVQIPTTLLAMVDASVGGKTGVDLPQGKNLVGAFKQPELVAIDPAVLNTLPAAEFRSGLAEVVKHGIINDAALFEALENDTYEMRWLLERAITVKVEVVRDDPFERGRRAVLNLGHTFGHAFEQLSNFEMRHGEGVAIGLVCAARLATHLGYCRDDTPARIIALLQHLKLPTEPPPHPPGAVWAAMFTDKKRQGNQVRFILPRTIGDVDIFEGITEADIETILR